jgi:cobalt-zinc-cadmium efflux system membrane fusion protein
MHIKNFLTTALALVSFLLAETACDRTGDRKANSSRTDTAIAEGTLRLTPDQTAQAGIVTGKMEYQPVGSILECNGRIEVPPSNMAQVMVPVGGLVKRCPLNPGDYVYTGQLLAVLEHPDYIKIQQDYLETKSQWEYYKEDFKRQGELTVENAASVKTMQQAQASFRSVEVKMFSLKNQLRLLGINADTLNIENMSSTVNINAPISGYITDINVNIGKYVGPEQMVCEILNKNTLHLQLFAGEKDIHRVSRDQSVEFSLISDPVNRYKAVVKAISPKIDASTKAFSIHARILQIQPVFNPGMDVKAFISTAEHSGFTLPASAVVEDNDEQVVFAKTSGDFKRVVIRTGITGNDRVEILDYPPGLPDSAIVLKGASYLNTTWNDQQP